ncbi:MAG: hypothetical protein ACK4UU_01360 [Fimbriimonadales bacterium]
MKRWLENPLLRYQLFGFALHRWKRQPWLYGAVAVGVGLTYLLVFQLVVFTQAPFSFALQLCLFVMCLTAPLMAYNLFSIEYEKQTWESLALTRLTAREILWGKWGAALARVALLTLLALPLLIANRELHIDPFSPSRGRFTTILEPTYHLYVFVAGISLLCSWGVLLVSLGMWLSFVLKRTLTTASTLYAGQVFVLLLMPILYLIFSEGETGTQLISTVASYKDSLSWWLYSLLTAEVILYLNPFWAANELTAIYWANSKWEASGWIRVDPSYAEGLIYLNWGFAQSALYLALALLFAGLTYRKLKYAWRK